MFEYVAFTCDPGLPDIAHELTALTERLPARDTWQVVFESSSLRVVCRPAHLLQQRVTLANDTIILGTWFPSETSPGSREPSFPPDGWGNYVALRATTPHHLRIYREPTAQLPCLYAIHGGFGVCASNFGTLRTVTGRTFPGSSSYLQEHLLGRLGTKRRQPLIGATAILGGEAVTLDLLHHDPPIRVAHWKPQDFMPVEASLGNRLTAHRELHTTLHRCTRAWLDYAQTGLVRLSGGLDSSIVFGCLATIAPDAIIPYTYFNPDGAGGERRWAHVAATFHGMTTLNVPFRPEAVHLPDIATTQPTLEPISTLPYLQRAPLERRLTTEHHAAAVFTGQGGDSGGCRDSIELIPLETRLQRGWRPNTLRVCAQVARHTDRSFWEVLAIAHRRSPLDSDQSLLAAMSQLIEPQVLHTEPIPSETHPWLRDTSMHPTLERRLGPLLTPTTYYDPCGPVDIDSPEIVSPLLSRPFVEACLRIPSYLHFNNGIERGLLRLAFEKELPAQIARRCWKDRAPGFIGHVLAQHRPFVREFLLDGLLVRSRWLSKSAVEAALAEGSTSSKVSALEIMNHLDTEVWLRHLQ